MLLKDFLNMHTPKRQRRRKRHLLKEELRVLDNYVLNKLKHNYTLSMSSWGGTKCPGCGINIRPAYLADIDYSGSIYEKIEDGRYRVTGHISAYGNACDSSYFKGKCPGERDWMNKYYF